MFGGQRSRYYEAPDGRRFAWNVEPTFTCPLASFERRKVEVIDPHEPNNDTTRTERVPTAAVESAAATLGCGAPELTRLLERQHASFTHKRRRVDGRLTDTCDCCGARMERKGFRVWIDRPLAEEELSSEQRVSLQIQRRLGGSDVKTETLRSFYLDTKREAKQWALDELRTAESAAREEAAA